MSIQDEAAEVIGAWIDNNLPHSEENFGVDEGIAEALAEHEPPLLAPNLTNITRLTVAGGGRRQLEEWAIHDVELSIQDNGQTLKVFYRKDAAHAEKENES